MVAFESVMTVLPMEWAAECRVWLPLPCFFKLQVSAIVFAMHATLLPIRLYALTFRLGQYMWHHFDMDYWSTHQSQCYSSYLCILAHKYISSR